MGRINGNRKYTFLCKEHEEFGGLGWCPTWMPNADPLEGMGVAHDILEHMPKTDGSTEDEFKALASAWWIRGETGWFYDNNPGNMNTSEQHIAADFPTILNRVIVGERTFNQPRKTMPLDSEVEEALWKIIVLGTQTHFEEYEEEPATSGFCDSHSRAKILGWMRIGYRQCKNRYNYSNVANYEVAQLFTEIMTEANKFLKYAEEGNGLAISVDVTNVKSVVDFIDYPDEDSYSIMPRW